MMKRDVSPTADFYVFGYGSLMWRPGFEHRVAEPALIVGRHRRLCVYSWWHRGTQERPGLVLGLDRGGACRGIAFSVDPSQREAVIAYLRAREQVTNVYRETTVRAKLADGRVVDALTYVVDRRHPQYAGLLPPARMIEIARAASGNSGLNPEYVLATARHLEELGIADRTLQAVAAALRDTIGADTPPEPAAIRPPLRA